MTFLRIGPPGRQQVRRGKRGGIGVCLTLHGAQAVGKVGDDLTSIHAAQQDRFFLDVLIAQLITPILYGGLLVRPKASFFTKDW